MVRVCVVGMGPIGNRHSDMIRLSSSGELVGVCDRIEERARAGGERLGVPWFTDAEAMLKSLAPGVVNVATGGYEYASDHYEPTMQALSAGCNVLVEKPISNEIARAEEMVALAAERDLCLGVDLNHRFTPAAEIAKRWQLEDKIGHLLFVNMSMWIYNPAESSPWFMIKALNPHTVDVMRHFCGDITHVHCYATTSPGRTIYTTAQFNMRFANGAVGSLTSSYDIMRGHPMERCEVAGMKGRFVLEDMYRQVTLYPADSWEKTQYTNPIFGGMESFVDTFRNRIHKFLAQVDAGVAPADIDGSGADGLAAQKVLQAAIESIQTGQAVEVG